MVVVTGGDSMAEVREFENCDDVTNSPIVNFYNDRSVFITGATGFMGKVIIACSVLVMTCTRCPQVLVEKLLRSTQVSNIFLLIRPKKGVSTKDRLQQLLSAPIFDKYVEEEEE